MKSVDAFLIELKKYIGVKESGGDNKGKQVELFQKAVDGKAQGESWCLAFAFFCVKKACEASGTKHQLFETEHCMTLWNKTPDKLKSSTPKVGSIAIYQLIGKDGKPTASGHAAPVVAYKEGNTYFMTIEGNTSDGLGINRNGDGVYNRKRVVNPTGSMRLKGFILPWG